jgi:hypothetical protein
MHPWRETLTYFFSFSGVTGTDSGKSASRHVMPNVCFFHLLGYAGHIVHSGASGVQNIETLIFMLMWDRYIFQKNCTGTLQTEHRFLHLWDPCAM